jgi:hypothetical protein
LHSLWDKIQILELHLFCDEGNKAEGAGADKTAADGSAAGTTREEAAEAGAPRGEAAGAVVGIPEHFEPSPTRPAPDPPTNLIGRAWAEILKLAIFFGPSPTRNAVFSCFTL